MSTEDAMGATAILARFVAKAEPREEDVAVLTRSLLNTRCATVAGRRTPAGRVILATAEDLGDDGPALEAWRDAGTAAASALDDVADYGAAGASVWPSLLALAASAGSDDEQVIAAGGIGMRAASALWRAGSYQEAERGFAGSRVFGVIASTAACARLLALDETMASGALSVAASQAGGLLANSGTTTDALHAASAARDGLVAATLAAAGLSGAPDIFEGRQGFGEAFFGLGLSHLDALASQLETTLGLESVLRSKLVPGHIDHQRPVRVLAAMLEGRDRAHVIRVLVNGIPPTSDGNRYHDPATAEQAAGSLRHALACVLATGTVRFGDLDPSAAVASEWMDRVEVRSSSRWDPRLEDPWVDADTISVWFEDGVELVGIVGDASTRVSAAELHTRWASVAQQLSEPERSMLIELARQLDNLD